MTDTTNATVKIHDLETGQVIVREMTDSEFTTYEKNQKELAEAKFELQTKATAKTALLDKLGITEDEAKLLLG